MLLDLTRYRRPVELFSQTFAPGEVSTGDEAYTIVAPVVLDVVIHKDGALKVGDRFRIVGTVEAALELSCSRCLEPYRLPVASRIDLRLHPASALSTESEQEVEEDDLGVSYYHDDQVDVNEMLREQFYLALPMKPLCRETCQGLCAECGANNNVTACGCVPHWEDPRLAPLKALTPHATRASKTSTDLPS